MYSWVLCVWSLLQHIYNIGIPVFFWSGTEFMHSSLKVQVYWRCSGNCVLFCLPERFWESNFSFVLVCMMSRCIVHFPLAPFIMHMRSFYRGSFPSSRNSNHEMNHLCILFHIRVYSLTVCPSNILHQSWSHDALFDLVWTPVWICHRSYALAKL